MQKKKYIYNNNNKINYIITKKIQYVFEVFSFFFCGFEHFLMFVCYFMFYVQQVYQAKEVIESNVQIKQALCATIIDTDRVCLGTEDGLFCIELMKESKFEPGILNQMRIS